MRTRQRPPGFAHFTAMIRGCRLLMGALLAATAATACAHGTNPTGQASVGESNAQASTSGSYVQASASGSDTLTPQILRKWQDRMIEYGHELGDYLESTSDPNKRLMASYYDAQWVFLRIAQYTGEREPWIQYATLAEGAFKHYLHENDYGVAGYRKFPHGLYVDWKRYGDEESKFYLLKMAENAGYQNPMRDIAEGWYAQDRSREIAYALQTQLLAEKAGAAPQPEKMDRFVDMALTHVNSWTTGQYVASDPENRFCKPFMAGLTASALISYYQRTVAHGDPDERVPTAIQGLADQLWQTAWAPDVKGSGYGAFVYIQPPVEGVGSDEPAPDLNMLIAPMYGWLYYHTGDDKYRQRGDAIFAGGVELAYLGSGKQFNQNYRSSFDYLRWRAAGDKGTQPPEIAELASRTP